MSEFVDRVITGLAALGGGMLSQPFQVALTPAPAAAYAYLRIEIEGLLQNTNTAMSRSRTKGQLVEEIAAWLHDAEGVGVERNVRRRGKSGSLREIDVLITAGIVGYPISIAIECKNETKAVGAPAIDAFVGKLLDIDIPSRLGVFVSASGYTRGALARAKVAGIRTLILKGLNRSRLAASVSEAFQSLVYVLAAVKEFRILNNLPTAASAYELTSFFDESGSLRSNVAQMLWEKWTAGEPPSILGIHEIKMSAPDGLRSVVAGKEVRVHAIEVTVEVVGLVLTLRGHAEQVSLAHAETGVVEKLGIRSFFEPKVGQYPLAVFRTEADLKQNCRTRKNFHLVRGRMRVPRILVFGTYWPLRRSSMERLKRIYEECIKTGTDPSSLKLKLSDIEGPDLSGAWEPFYDLENAE